jgi:putative transposase
MRSVIVSLLVTLRTSLRERAGLQLEILALRHQLQVLERTRPRRMRLTRSDQLLWVWLSRVWPGWRSAVVIVKPETILAWHRRGFRLFWRWKSRRRLGRPVVPPDVRLLIQTMAKANPLWGPPRIHGELLKLGIDISQATVAKYMPRHRRPPSQTWRTFLANHVDQIVAADFFLIPTATYRLLFVLVVLAYQRRRVVHVAVTAHPTAAWTAQQLREAFPADGVPRYLIRDRDSAFAGIRTTAIGMGIQKVLTAPHRPDARETLDRCLDQPPQAGANEIRAIRLRLGLSQPQFATLLGVSADTYRTWDSGRRVVSDAWLDIARALAATNDPHRLWSLQALATELGVHVRTLRDAARVGRLDVVYENRVVFRNPIPRASLTAGRRFMERYYRRSYSRFAAMPHVPEQLSLPSDWNRRLVQIRRELQLTQEGLAERIGAAGKAVVYQWESGKRKPSPVFWRRIEALIR